MVYPGEHPLLPSLPSARVLPDYTAILGVMGVSIAAVSVADTSGWASLMNQDIRHRKSGQSAAWQCLMGVRGGATSTAHAETFPDLPPSSSTSRDSPSNRRSTRATCQAAIRNGGCELCNIYI